MLNIAANNASSKASERDYRVTAVVDAISGLTPPDVAWLESIGINFLTTAQLIALMEGNVSEALTQTGVHAP